MWRGNFQGFWNHFVNIAARPPLGKRVRVLVFLVQSHEIVKQSEPEMKTCKLHKRNSQKNVLLFYTNSIENPYITSLLSPRYFEWIVLRCLISTFIKNAIFFWLSVRLYLFEVSSTIIYLGEPSLKKNGKNINMRVCQLPLKKFFGSKHSFYEKKIQQQKWRKNQEK